MPGLTGRDYAAPERLSRGDGLAAVHALFIRAFAGMEGRIDPPSSLNRMTPAALARLAEASELWVIRPAGPAEAAPAACMVLTPAEDHLYLGKLATAPEHLRRGLARRLIDTACDRARALSLPELRLQTRIELTENHATFRALGFTERARTAHPGFDRLTSITFARPA